MSKRTLASNTFRPLLFFPRSSLFFFFSVLPLILLCVDVFGFSSSFSPCLALHGLPGSRLSSASLLHVLSYPPQSLLHAVCLPSQRVGFLFENQTGNPLATPSFSSFSPSPALPYTSLKTAVPVSDRVRNSLLQAGTSLRNVRHQKRVHRGDDGCSVQDKKKRRNLQSLLHKRKPVYANRGVDALTFVTLSSHLQRPQYCRPGIIDVPHVSKSSCVKLK